MTGIREVSARAGVSVATVSRTLTTPAKVAPKTRRQVLAAVRALNYRPNLLARNFRSRRSYAIVVLVPNIANPFFSSVVRGIEQVAQQNGYAVLLGDTQGMAQREEQYMRLVASNQADGIIQLSARLNRKALGRLWRKGTTPAIVNACECVDRPFCPSIRLDNILAARHMTDHLTGLGHRRIAAVMGPAESPLTRDRLKGFRQGLRAAGLTGDQAMEISGDFSIRSGAEAGRRILSLKRRPTAVFCFNDEMALGVMHQLLSAGVTVPQQISVAGFDDIEFARFATPPLTTMAQPMQQMGAAAMMSLIELLRTGTLHSSERTFAAELVVRQSTSAPESR